LVHYAVAFSAVRCTVSYVVLPFVLPVLGLAAGAGILMMLMCDAIAALAMVSALRRFWRTAHPQRWTYLAVACTVLLVLGGLLMVDAYQAANVF
jgi:hypothetical protein